MQLGDVLPAALASGVAAAAAFAAGMAMDTTSFWRIVAGVPAGVVAYIIVTFTFRMSAFRDIAKALRPTFEKKHPRSAAFFAAVERRFAR